MSLVIKELGLVDYQDSFQEMQNFNKARNPETNDEIWFLEHKPVYTLGYQGDKSHLINTTEFPIIHSDRGGNVTYHGPGQLVGYFLIDLKRKKLSVHQLVKNTENIIIDILKEYGIKGHLIDGAPGIYVDNRKICSLGFRVKRGCSYHGFALNVDMELSPFNSINPCGLMGMKVTQISEFDQKIDFKQLRSAIIIKIQDYFEYNTVTR